MLLFGNLFLMVSSTETAAEKVTGTSRLDIFFEVLDRVELLYGIISVFSVIAICCISLLFFRSKTEQYTKRQISILKKNQKYIPGIFVELNDSKEMLRYFAYGKKWKKRLIENFNLLYNNFYGDILKNALQKEDVIFHLDKSTALQDIGKSIDNALDLHIKFRKREIDFKPEYDESKYLFEVVSYPYTDYLERLQRFSKVANFRYIVLTGSAGNGKTNLLCSISELLIKRREAVAFINSRDVKGNILDYLMKALNIPGGLSKHKKLYWGFVNLLLKSRGKLFFVVIDAVNENDDAAFGADVTSFINEISQYSQAKVIVSCRNEYFEERFRTKLVDDVNIPAYIFDVKDMNYNSTAIERIINAYKKYFDYSGNISEAVKNVLCEQLLLLRIFFEVNRGSDRDINTIRKYELFEEYIDQVEKKCGIHITNLLDILANRMFESGKYDGVSFHEITVCGVTGDEVKGAIDGSILLSKKLVTHAGTIASEEREMVYFVFDELRDYYLARCLIKRHVAAEGVESDLILKELRELKDQEVSCVEGIIHYCYIFFRTDTEICAQGKDIELCNSILELYRIKEKSEEDMYWGWEHQIEFTNLGLRLIMTSDLQINGMEMEYIRDCLQKAPGEDSGALFNICLQGTINGAMNDFDVYLDILFGLDDFDMFTKVFRHGIGHNGLGGKFSPLDFLGIHKYLLDKRLDAAIQVQKVAELFLHCFKVKDYEVQELLEEYFFELDSHERINNMMIRRVQESYSFGGRE